jgi:hypothetical protein
LSTIRRLADPEEPSMAADVAVVRRLLSVLDPPRPGFPIVTP